MGGWQHRVTVYYPATISSTMIPRIQQDAYRSHWSRFAFRTAGMLSFITGLIFAVLLETLNTNNGH